MSDKVLLAVLKERQSARGTRYLSGWLGKARLIAFLDREAPEGEIVWQVFAQAPEERAGEDQTGRNSGGRPSRDGATTISARRPNQRQARGPDRTRTPVPTGELDDALPW